MITYIDLFIFVSSFILAFLSSCIILFSSPLLPSPPLLLPSSCPLLLFSSPSLREFLVASLYPRGQWPPAEPLTAGKAQNKCHWKEGRWTGLTG